MKRKQVIELYKGYLQDTRNSLKVIQEIPLGALLKLRTIVWLSINGKWKRNECDVVGIGCSFNCHSIRMELVAVEKNGHPFDRNKSVAPVRFSNIKSWDIFPQDSLPLCIGFDIVYAPLEKMLKGEKCASLS